MRMGMGVGKELGMGMGMVVVNFKIVWENNVRSCSKQSSSHTDTRDSNVVMDMVKVSGPMHTRRRRNKEIRDS